MAVNMKPLTPESSVMVSQVDFKVVRLHRYERIPSDRNPLDDNVAIQMESSSGVVTIATFDGPTSKSWSVAHEVCVQLQSLLGTPGCVRVCECEEEVATQD